MTAIKPRKFILNVIYDTDTIVLEALLLKFYSY